jgi:hypothetical protein
MKYRFEDFPENDAWLVFRLDTRHHARTTSRVSRCGYSGRQHSCDNPLTIHVYVALSE